MDKKNISQLVYIDYRKAFDTINHKILFKKLKQYYNVGKTPLIWFENYLTNRKQQIIQQNDRSELLDVNIGVPQGSVLGPTLFIMYVNDLFRIIDDEQCDMIMYADDTVLYTSSKTFDEGYNKLEANLHAVIKWCTNNRLTLNISKTKHMIVGHAPGDNIVVNKRLQYNQQQIEIVSDYSYLGVELDNNLTMEKQINKSVNKANKKLFMIGKLRKCLSNRTTALLYKQLVCPHLEYCDFLVDSSLKKHKKV